MVTTGYQYETLQQLGDNTACVAVLRLCSLRCKQRRRRQRRRQQVGIEPWVHMPRKCDLGAQEAGAGRYIYWKRWLNGR
jgi:hypothetical protein